jgi:hypothetical protein
MLLQRKAYNIENDVRRQLRNFGLKVGIVGAVGFEQRVRDLAAASRLLKARRQSGSWQLAGNAPSRSTFTSPFSLDSLVRPVRCDRRRDVITTFRATPRRCRQLIVSEATNVRQDLRCLFARDGRQGP